MSNRRRRQILAVIAGICGLLAIWFGYSFFRTSQEYERGRKDLDAVYQAMGETLAEPPEEGGDDSGDTEAEVQPGDRQLWEQQRLEQYERLHDTNRDMVGWVRIRDTVIDYPVMQTPDDPNYYLHRGFDKEYSAYGMIYMDGKCTLNEPCPNYLLYGHHMKNGSMFASLEKYESEEYRREHPVIGFDTLTEVGDYEVFAVFKVRADVMDREFFENLAARTEEDYEDLISYARAHSLYDTDVVPQWPEQLITLSTCEYSQKNGRLLVMARKVGEPLTNDET